MGLNGGSKRSLIRSLTKQWGATSVFVETKLRGVDNALFKEVWANRWMDEFHLDAVGRSGGILVMWDKRYWKGELIGLLVRCLHVN